MAKVNDLSRSLAALEQDTTLIAVVELSAKRWLVCASVPGVERQPLKKVDPDAAALLAMIERWRGEAERAGRPIARVVVAYEAGRVDAEHRFAMTASGWRAGCWRVEWRHTSSIRPRLPSRASASGPRPTGWMRRC